VIGAKAVAFGEAMTNNYSNYMKRVQSNAKIMSELFIEKGYNIISGGTDNHCMLIDLRTKGINGKDAEELLGKVDITVNKNMVPFDTESPFVTSGIRIGTAAITSRGIQNEDMPLIASLIDKALMNPSSEQTLKKIQLNIHELMGSRPLFEW
jgi:glycine hydroxymethyltransferase